MANGVPLSRAEQAERLRQRLAQMSWPQVYMFKFVLPNDRVRLDRLVEMLPTSGRTSFGNSKQGNYVSVTCVVSMASADAVMDITNRACEIEGLISL